MPIAGLDLVEEILELKRERNAVILRTITRSSRSRI
jgi:hypothetical protein